MQIIPKLRKNQTFDPYITPLLFAYGKVPYSSLTFPLCELIYGPLTVLKDLWTVDGLIDEVKET